MDIQTAKITLIQSILSLKDERVLKSIQSFLNSKTNDVTPMTLDEFYKRIKASEKDFKEGRFKDAETIRSKYA